MVCARCISVKIQLTKDKTVDISLPFGGGKRKKSDVTGVELYSSDEEGCPAVRVYRKKNEWHIGAIGTISEPDGVMPDRWDDIPRQPTWSFPHNFQAPHAAIAVNSTLGTFGQASPDAIIQEMMTGVQTPAAPEQSAAAPKRRLGVKRPQTAPAAAAKPATPARRPEMPADGVPVSENGRRFVVRPFAEDGFRLAASLPEFQALWLGRLLPEGRRPTACSIQLAESALMASILLQPIYREAKGTLLAVFVRRDAVYFAGYKEGCPALWRRCPGVGGYEAMRDAVKKTLGVGDDLVESVLEESLVDPRPALDPYLHTVFAQVELARAYLSGKHGLNDDRVLLLGLPAGAVQWRRFAEDTLKLRVESPGPFEGLVLDKGVEAARPHACLTALGAALAALEATT